MLLETLQVAIPIVVTFVFSLLLCGGGNKGPARKIPIKNDSKDSKDKDTSAELPKAPADKNASADTQDPNYQTMAGLGGECFGADKQKGSSGTPTPGGGAAAPAGPAAPPPKPPNVQGAPMAATADPNYQTLAGVGGDCFGNDKKKDEPKMRI